jgi:hypothetical protein
MIPRTELRTLLICTFRYALGRKTYATLESSELIKNYHDVLDGNSVNQIIKDIDYGDKTDMLGNDCDKKIWLELKDWLLKKEKEIKSRTI